MKKLLLVPVLAGMAVLGHSSTLWGLSSNFFSNTDTGKLYTIDETTGVATFRNNVTDSGGNYILATSIAGATYLNGTFYACDVFGKNGDFGSIDLNTGIFTAIGNQNGGINWYTLAADPTSGTMYTVERDGGQADNGHLLSVSTTDGSTQDLGQLTDGSGNNLVIDNLAFDSQNSTLYGLNGGSLYTINIGADVATLVNSNSVSTSNVADMTYDAANNTFFVSDGQTLYSVDPATGNYATLGANGTTETIDGLAVVPVPEPGSLALVGLGGFALLRRRRKATA